MGSHVDQDKPIWISYKLKFEGRDADNHLLEAHPTGQSLEGFSWALALALNYGITGRLRYSRDLSKSAKVFISPPRQGSVLYDLNILVQQNPFLSLIVGGYVVNTVTPYINGLIGYLFNQAVGLGSEFSEEAKKYLLKLDGEELNAITRRIEPPLSRAHYAVGRTADEILLRRDATNIIKLDMTTKDNLKAEPTGEYDTLDTNVTSFNVLTGNGRLFSPETETTLPFSLRDNSRHGTTTTLIQSMEQYALGRKGAVRIVGERTETKGGRLTKYFVSAAEEIPKSDWVDGIDPLRTQR